MVLHLTTKCALLLGWMLDLAFGDPANLPHPIVWFGKWIAMWERKLNQGEHRMQKGAVLAVVSIIMVYVMTAVVIHHLTPHRVSSIVAQSLVVFFCLAGHTLRREVKAVFVAVARSTEEGRRQVARIVGRDTTNLSPQEIRTAALETLAENLSDGVIAPLFYFALLGAPGMLAYKMVNTLDSMLGYRTVRFRNFGCWAARIDDVANFVPARLTAMLIIVVGWLYSRLSHFPSSQSLGSLFRFTVHYGPQHASPNSGWPEAALAALLNCRFGGTHNYFGETVPKPHIGTNPRLLTDQDMRTGINVCLAAECLAIFILVFIA